MKTALRKDQARRTRVKSKRASKSGNKTSFQSELNAALKMYSDFQHNKARNKVRPNKSVISTEGSKVSGSCDNQNSQHIPSYKVSICPVKRPVSSIEMGIPIVKPTVSLTKSNNNRLPPGAPVVQSERRSSMNKVKGKAKEGTEKLFAMAWEERVLVEAHIWAKSLEEAMEMAGHGSLEDLVDPCGDFIEVVPGSIECHEEVEGASKKDYKSGGNCCVEIYY